MPRTDEHVTTTPRGTPATPASAVPAAPAPARERTPSRRGAWAAAVCAALATPAGAAASAGSSCPVSTAVGSHAGTALRRYAVAVADGGPADLDGAADGGCDTTVRVCLGESGVCAPDAVRVVHVVGARGSDAVLRVRDAVERIPGSTRGTAGRTRVDAAAVADTCAEARVRVPAGRSVPLRVRADGARTRVVLRCLDDPAAPASTCRAASGACPGLAPPACSDAGCAAATSAANVASLATTTAVGESGPPVAASGATDGIVPLAPGNPVQEWVAGPDGATFVRLVWPTPVAVERVVLYDRAAPGADVRGATVVADDADGWPVGPLPADGAPYTVVVGPRTLRTLTVAVTEAAGAAGLAEIAVLAPDDDGVRTARAAGGRTWWLSPHGSDANPGTSAARPFRTFRKALEGRRLQPGDRLLLLDGEYTRGTTGLPRIDCSASGNARSGTPQAPITVAAANERRAHVAADGATDAFDMNACSWWRLEGLRGSNRDGGAAQAWDGNVFQVTRSSHVVLRRLLATRPNRSCAGAAPGACNAHAIAITDSHHVLVEESEAYDFHRHGISVFASRWVTLRRCYVHPRAAGTPTAIILYGSSDSIVENCIAEASGGINIAGTRVYDGSPGGYRNALLGVIALDGAYGSTIRARRFGSAILPVGHNVVRDSVFARVANVGVFARGAADTLLDHVTLYASRADCGLVADEDRGEGARCSANPEGCGVTARSVLSFAHRHRGARIDTSVVRRWSIERSRFASNGAANFPTSEPPGDASGNIRWSNATVPTRMGLGTNRCIAWVPDGSNGKRAGEAGTDVGATVLYRYEGGVLTGRPLWDRATGAFPCGAVVAGVNDQAGRACRDVHRRLNVGTNGCAFPASFG